LTHTLRAPRRAVVLACLALTSAVRKPMPAESPTPRLEIPHAAPHRRPRLPPRERQAGGALLSLAFVAPLILGACRPETVVAVGTVERRTLELAAPISERIVSIPVRPGQRIASGEVLVRLDVEVAELELKAVTAALAEAEAVLTAARREYDRTAGLARSRVLSTQELDRATRALAEAEATQAERAARAAQARRRLADLTVRASASGVVDQLPFEAGERVPAGGVVAVVLADDAPWVRVWLPARVVSRLRVGAPAEVAVEGIDATLRGRLQDIAREPEFTPHFALTERERDHLVYESRVALVDAPAELRPGVAATVRIRLGAGR
jgi:HlyD family secretion protein